MIRILSKARHSIVSATVSASGIIVILAFGSPSANSGDTHPDFKRHSYPREFGLVSRELPASPLGPLSPRTGLLLKDEIVVRLIQTSSGDRAHDYVSHIALWDREQVAEGFRRAAEWVEQRAREFGLEQVAIERFPSDGKIEYFGEVMPPQWKVRKGEL